MIQNVKNTLEKLSAKQKILLGIVTLFQFPGIEAAIQHQELLQGIVWTVVIFGLLGFFLAAFGASQNGASFPEALRKALREGCIWAIGAAVITVAFCGFTNAFGLGIFAA